MHLPCWLFCMLCYRGRAVANVGRTCCPTPLFLLIMYRGNKICLYYRIRKRNTGVLERTRQRRVRSLGRTLIDKASLQNVSVTLIRALWINEAENKIVVVRNVL